MAKRIFEIVGKGKGVIDTLTPANLLELNSPSSGAVGTIDEVLTNGNQVTSDTPIIYPDNGIARTVYSNGDVSMDDPTTGNSLSRHYGGNDYYKTSDPSKATKERYETPTGNHVLIKPNETGTYATREWTNSQGFEKQSNKGVANGYAPLGSDSKVPATNSRASNVTYNSANGVLTYTWADGSVQTIDLPVENLFQNASYNSTTKTLTLTTNGGGTVDIPLTDLVDLPEIQVSANANPSVTPSTGQRLYLRADNGAFWISSGGSWVGPYYGVTAAEKTDWNGKQDALGFTPENSDNKATTMTGNTTSNTKFLSAKAVYDWVIGLGYQTATQVSSAISSALAGYATQTWVNSQGFITSVANASASISGIMKLFTSTGTATDGTMTQKAITDALALITPIETTTDGTVTSGVSITVSSVLTIPAGTYGAGMTLDAIAVSRKTGTNGTLSMRFYANTTPDLSGSPILLGQGSFIASNLQGTLQKLLRIKVTDGTGAGTEITNSGTTNVLDYVGVASASQNVAINWNNTVYIIATNACGSGSDSARTSSLKIRR